RLRHRRQLERPRAFLVRGGGEVSAEEGDCDGLVRLCRSPDGNFHPALKDHVIAEERGERDGGVREGRDAADENSDVNKARSAHKKKWKRKMGKWRKNFLFLHFPHLPQKPPPLLLPLPGTPGRGLGRGASDSRITKCGRLLFD